MTVASSPAFLVGVLFSLFQLSSWSACSVVALVLCIHPVGVSAYYGFSSPILHAPSQQSVPFALVMVRGAKEILPLALGM